MDLFFLLTESDFFITFHFFGISAMISITYNAVSSNFIYLLCGYVVISNTYSCLKLAIS